MLDLAAYLPARLAFIAAANCEKTRLMVSHALSIAAVSPCPEEEGGEEEVAVEEKF